MPRTDIAFLITGDLHRNIRALKQLRSLADGGYTVRVFHLGGSPAQTPLPDGVSEEIVSVAAGRGPLYFHRLHRAYKHALAGFSARLYHASDLYALASCAEAASPNAAQYSFDSRELYAHVAATKNRPWVTWWWSRLERRLLPGAACMFTVSDSIADYLESAYGLPRPKVVCNVPETRILRTSAPDKAPDQSPVSAQDSTLVKASEVELTLRDLLHEQGISTELPTMVHLGQMKKDRGCESLIRAMVEVPNARLLFLGYGSLEPALKRLTNELNVGDRVSFVPPVGPRHVRAALVGAALGITMLEDTCLNHRFALPNKLFDYLHAGIPVLSSDLDEVKRVVLSLNIGRTTDPGDPHAIATVMREMLADPTRKEWSENAIKAAETFSWDNASQIFMQEINRVLPLPFIQSS